MQRGNSFPQHMQWNYLNDPWLDVRRVPLNCRSDSSQDELNMIRNVTN